MLEQAGAAAERGPWPVKAGDWLSCSPPQDFDPAAIDQYPAVFQIVDVGPLGMQDGLQITGSDVLHHGTH